MARHANQSWNLPDGVQSWESVHAALLMDIRDELAALKRMLANPCFGKTLKRIDRRLATRMPLRPLKKA